jgi:hypothetical protein
LKAKDALRATTAKLSKRETAVMRSSVTPSAKKGRSGSGLRFAKGRTATLGRTEGALGAGAAGASSISR